MKTSLPLKDVIPVWIDHLGQVRRLSPQTLRAYEQDAREWVTLFAEMGVKTGEDWEKVQSPRQLIRAALEKRMKGLESVSLSRKLAALRVFFRFLKEHSFLGRDLAALVPSPRVKRGLPRFAEVE